ADLVARVLSHGPAEGFVAASEDPGVRRRRAALGASGASAAPGAIAAPTDGSGLHARPNLRNPFVAPRNEMERSVAQIWAELLRLESVGALDSFFDLGGDSLLATQVATRIHESFSVEIPLPDFFETPTTAALAERIEAGQKDREAEADALAKMIAELDTLSPEEVERMLAERGIGPELDA